MKKMYKVAMRIGFTLLVISASVILCFIPALASFLYADIVIQSVGNSLIYFPVDIGVDTSALIAAGDLNADGMNINIQIDFADIPFMVAEDRIIIVAPDLPSDTDKTVKLYADYIPFQTALPIVIGHDAYMYTPSNPLLALGTEFEITIDGYWNCSINSEILYAEHNTHIYIQGGNVFWEILDSSDNEVASISTPLPVDNFDGYIIFSCYPGGDDTMMVIEIEGEAPVESIGLGIPIPHEEHDWIWNQNSEALSYINSITIVDDWPELGDVVIHYDAQTTMVVDETIPDRAGNEDGIIVWGTNDPDIEVDPPVPPTPPISPTTPTDYNMLANLIAAVFGLVVIISMLLVLASMQITLGLMVLVGVAGFLGVIGMILLINTLPILIW